MPFYEAHYDHGCRPEAEGAACTKPPGQFALICAADDAGDDGSDEPRCERPKLSLVAGTDGETAARSPFADRPDFNHAPQWWAEEEKTVRASARLLTFDGHQASARSLGFRAATDEQALTIAHAHAAEGYLLIHLRSAGRILRAARFYPESEEPFGTLAEAAAWYAGLLDTLSVLLAEGAELDQPWQLTELGIGLRYASA
jgi:hypothetical protein